jgi:hypothetical protein
MPLRKSRSSLVSEIGSQAKDQSAVWDISTHKVGKGTLGGFSGGLFV